jgi:hypothetical protein
MRRLRQALEDAGLDQHDEAVRHPPVLHDVAPTTRATSSQRYVTWEAARLSRAVLQ